MMFLKFPLTRRGKFQLAVREAQNLTLNISSKWTSWSHPKTNEEYSISLQISADLTPAEFEACFCLIEATSAEDYKNSKDGWHPKAKRREMKLLDLKYLLVRRDGHLEGFASFMPTNEDDYPVIYCYEIHLSLSLRGCVTTWNHILIIYMSLISIGLAWESF
jgi:hypothetical protein